MKARQCSPIIILWNLRNFLHKVSVFYEFLNCNIEFHFIIEKNINKSQLDIFLPYCVLIIDIYKFKIKNKKYDKKSLAIIWNIPKLENVGKGKKLRLTIYIVRFCVKMKKSFATVRDIERFYEQRRIRNEQTRLNYYKAKTKLYISKINQEAWLLDKYLKKFERYKIANANKCEREKRSAIAEFERQIKKWLKTTKFWNRSVNIKTAKRITKSMAREELQLYCKISRADKNGIVEEITTGDKVHWRLTQGWHYVSASIAQTCFDENNIRPQYWWSNKQMSQWDKQAMLIKEKYRKNLVKRIGEEAVQNLERIEKYWKNELIKSWWTLFSEIYKKYKELNDKIFESHPWRNRKAELDESWKKWKEEHS